MAAGTAVRRLRHPGLPQRRPPGAGGAAGPAGRRRGAALRRCAGCSTPTTCGSGLVDAGAERVAEFSLARLAERYLPVYETAIAVAP